MRDRAKGRHRSEPFVGRTAITVSEGVDRYRGRILRALSLSFKSF